MVSVWGRLWVFRWMLLSGWLVFFKKGTVFHTFWAPWRALTADDWDKSCFENQEFANPGTQAIPFPSFTTPLPNGRLRKRWPPCQPANGWLALQAPETDLHPWKNLRKRSLQASCEPILLQENCMFVHMFHFISQFNSFRHSKLLPTTNQPTFQCHSSQHPTPKPLPSPSKTSPSCATGQSQELFRVTLKAPGTTTVSQTTKAKLGCSKAVYFREESWFSGNLTGEVFSFWSPDSLEGVWSFQVQYLFSLDFWRFLNGTLQCSKKNDFYFSKEVIKMNRPVTISCSMYSWGLSFWAFQWIFHGKKCASVGFHPATCQPSIPSVPTTKFYICLKTRQKPLQKLISQQTDSKLNPFLQSQKTKPHRPPSKPPPQPTHALQRSQQPQAMSARCQERRQEQRGSPRGAEQRTSVLRLDAMDAMDAVTEKAPRKGKRSQVWSASTECWFFFFLLFFCRGEYKEESVRGGTCFFAYGVIIGHYLVVLFFSSFELFVSEPQIFLRRGGFSGFWSSLWRLLRSWQIDICWWNLRLQVYLPMSQTLPVDHWNIWFERNSQSRKNRTKS